MLLKMARELQKELQLSPRTAACPQCQPHDSGRSGRCKAKATAGAGLQLRDRAAEERQLFLLTPLPRAHTDPPQRQRCRGSEGTMPGCSSLPATWALNHLFWGEDTVNLDVGPCPRVVLGRKALQGPSWEMEEGV